MPRFTIGIGQHAYHSPDGATTWARSFREAPARHMPIVRGKVDLSCLPSQHGNTSWDFITVLPCGFGVAVGHRLVDDLRSTASVFLTEEGGRRWRQGDWKVHWPGEPCKRPACWPVEKLASLALPMSGCLALAWEQRRDIA